MIERTFGRLMLRRRPARGYETEPASSEAMIHMAMIGTAKPAADERRRRV